MSSVMTVPYDCRNTPHTSKSDNANHATVRVKIQLADATHQVAHIYIDANYNYTGHNLYPGVKND